MGWIKIDRKIQSSDLWLDDEPFCRRAAWVDMILLANHTGRDVLLGNQTVWVERGQFITSQDKLAERWRWTRKRVRTFLSTLVKLEMIEVATRAKRYTAITLVNYSVYQYEGPSEGQQKANKRPTEGQQRAINKNNKNYKNYKNNNNAAAYAREQTSNQEVVDREALPSEKPICIGEGDIGQALRLYESNIGPITPIIAEQMKALLDEVGFGCYKRAVERACRNNALRYGYVEAVAKGLASGVDYEATRGKSGGNLGAAFAAYLGGDDSADEAANS